MKLAVIGVPYNSAGVPGAESGAPAAYREAGLIDELRRCHDVADYGDIPTLPPNPARDPATGMIAPAALLKMTAAVSRRVARAYRERRLPVVVGGECPLLLGCLAAAREAHGRVGLLFVDGHEDAWPPHRSTTGEAADMELGLALGLTRVPELEDLAAMLPLVNARDTIVLGPRDGAELRTDGVPSIAPSLTFLDDRSIRHSDVAALTSSLTRRLNNQVGHWWFHVDLDVLSSAAMPAVRYPQPGGLSWEQLAQIAGAVLRSPGLIGWDITIYNPDLDPDRRAAAQIVSFLSEMTRGAT